jgi:hypothetical protein
MEKPHYPPKLAELLPSFLLPSPSRWAGGRRLSRRTSRKGEKQTRTKALFAEIPGVEKLDFVNVHRSTTISCHEHKMHQI